MDALVDELRQLVVSSLRLARHPDSIPPDAYLFGADLGLDSVDAVQLVAAIERRFEVVISDAELARLSFASVASMAEMLREKGCGSQPPLSPCAPLTRKRSSSP